jgi:hypothetical protein
MAHVDKITGPNMSYLNVKPGATYGNQCALRDNP